MTLSELESRLAVLEAKVQQLQATVPQAADQKPAVARDRWWERIHGTFENDDAFKEAMRLGREWRTGKKRKPATRKAKAKRRGK
jgi:hypothetical protein